MRSLPRIVSVAVAVVLTLIASGCGTHRGSPLGVSNQPPTVSLTSIPAGHDAHALRWLGSDPDGRVDHYVVSTDPRAIARRAPLTDWTRADGTSRLLGTGRARPATDEDARLAIEPTFFSVRAVDDDGEASDPATISFFGDNVAPVVQIVQPVPNALVTVQVPPAIRIRWEGNDPDGATPMRLTKYKYALLGPGSEFPLEIALVNPDSLRRRYAPSFAGWDSLPGDSLGVTLTGLIPGQQYLFVLVGFDAAGDYSPVFSLTTNMLRMQIVLSETHGPQMTVMAEGLYKQFVTGGVNDSLFTVTLRAPARDPVQVRWTATPALGATIVAYRWAIDIADPADETPRLTPLDVRHWSRWSATGTSATVSPLLPFPPRLSRRLSIEVRDSNGLRSRVNVVVEFLTVRRTRPTLVVLDLRVQPEVGLGTGTVRPAGAWPNAAELDSFLVARGGVPWLGYPSGSLSSPGLFAGQDVDVFRTQSLSLLDRSVPLELLMRYRNVVWIVDPNVALGTPALGAFGGIHSLRYMSVPGRQNTLVPYVQGGGRLWVVGGGGAYAMSVDQFNRTQNDFYTFTYSSRLDELVPGRPMWDLARWRSEFSVFATSTRLVNRIAPTFTRQGMPDYSQLPATLQTRTAATDPLPPQRTANQFYLGIRTTFEYLTLPNVVTESCSPWPDSRAVSVLDSLYTVRGVYPGGVDLPCMTVYRGHDGGQVVFSGFDLWSWQRPQCRALVDGVLRDLWHLTPTTEAAGVAAVEDPATDDEGLIRR
jgi:hypothetical protein